MLRVYATRCPECESDLVYKNMLNNLQEDIFYYCAACGASIPIQNLHWEDSIPQEEKNKTQEDYEKEAKDRREGKMEELIKQKRDKLAINAALIPSLIFKFECAHCGCTGWRNIVPAEDPLRFLKNIVCSFCDEKLEIRSIGTDGIEETKKLLDIIGSSMYNPQNKKETDQ